MIVFLIDADNLCAPAWIDEAFKKLEHDGGAVAVRRAYGSAEKLKGVASVLLARAIRPYANLSLSKNTTDVALAVDAMELSCLAPIPATVVIGSGDADFVPLVVRLRERGIRMVCVSESGKMSPEAVPWYDEVILVGQEQIASNSALPSETVIKAVARKTPIIKVSNPAVPAKKSPALKVPVKKAVASATKKASNATSSVEVRHILKAVPALKTGQAQALGEVVKLLHDAKLLGKNATSTKLFKKFPHQFELLPSKQPNRVQYILPLSR